MSFQKHEMQVPALIQCVGSLHTGPTPCSVQDGTCFKFSMGDGRTYYDCYNMVAENFLKIAKLRKLETVSILLYTWEHEFPLLGGHSPLMPEERHAALVVDHRFPES